MKNLFALLAGRAIYCTYKHSKNSHSEFPTTTIVVLLAVMVIAFFSGMIWMGLVGKEDAITQEGLKIQGWSFLDRFMMILTGITGLAGSGFLAIYAKKSKNEQDQKRQILLKEHEMSQKASNKN